MARFLFWEPYNKAILYGDLRDLIDEYKAGHPLTNEPEVKALLYEHMNLPIKTTNMTSLRDSFPLVRQIKRELIKKPGMSEYRAMKIVLEKNPRVKENSLNFWWSQYKRAVKAHTKIIDENQ